MSTPTNTKADLLRHYRTKPVQRFWQIDGFVRTWGDSVIPSDEDGDALMGGATHELMSTPGDRLPVRILIHEDARPEDVYRLLTKARDWLEAKGAWMVDERDDFDHGLDDLPDNNQQEGPR